MGSVPHPRQEPRSVASHCSPTSRWSPCLEGHPALTSQLSGRWSFLVPMNSRPVCAWGWETVMLWSRMGRCPGLQSPPPWGDRHHQ